MRHQAALRALAFKRLRVLHRGWVDRTPTDNLVVVIPDRKTSPNTVLTAARASSAARAQALRQLMRKHDRIAA
jgi:hypothetical protein